SSTSSGRKQRRIRRDEGDKRMDDLPSTGRRSSGTAWPSLSPTAGTQANGFRENVQSGCAHGFRRRGEPMGAACDNRCQLLPPAEGVNRVAAWPSGTFSSGAVVADKGGQAPKCVCVCRGAMQRNCSKSWAGEGAPCP